MQNDDLDDIDWSAPGIGGNNPPIDLDLAEALNPDAIAAYLGERFERHLRRANELMVADERFVAATADGIYDDDIAARATDHIRMLKAASKATDECRVDVKAPVLAAQRQIDGVAKAITDPLDVACKRAEGRVRDHLKRKEAAARASAEAEARRLVEEARKLAAAAEKEGVAELAAEATDAARAAEEKAQASAADLSRIHTATAGVASLKVVWKFRVTDVGALLRAVLAGKESFDLIAVNHQALQARATSLKDKAAVIGVEFYPDNSVTIR